MGHLFYIPQRPVSHEPGIRTLALSIWDSFSQDEVVQIAHIFAETRFDAEYIFLHGVLSMLGRDFWQTSYTVTSYTAPNFTHLQPYFAPKVTGEGFGSSAKPTDVLDFIGGDFLPFSILAHQRLTKLSLLADEPVS